MKKKNISKHRYKLQIKKGNISLCNIPDHSFAKNNYPLEINCKVEY